jgi:long-chain acyl-CoA synthetase
MVEEAILLHPAVAEASVCGVPDRHRGETIKAYVRLSEGAELSAAELRRFLRDKLAPFEQPKAIEFRDELPLTWLGKPSRRALIA